jgi:glycolate oxidase iron-sulfur subunit
LLRWALRLARLGRPFASLIAACGLKPVAAMLRLAPARLPPRDRTSGRRVLAAAQGTRRGRVALLSGCVSPVIQPGINQAAIRVLTRHGIEVVLAAGEGCCGSLVHHLGREEDALAAARANIDAWMEEIAAGGLDAIVVTASGCGTTVKDYGFMLRGDSAYAAKAARISALARDITEYLAGLDLSPAGESEGLIIAYHSACSLQHGQKIARQPKDLLCKIGFVVKDVPEGHLCCGSAGTYNILQPDIARRLRDRKVGNIERLEPDVIAAGNIGCITQIAAGTAIPVVHTVELIDWATGGRKPEALMRGA